MLIYCSFAVGNPSGDEVTMPPRAGIRARDHTGVIPRVLTRGPRSGVDRDASYQVIRRRETLPPIRLRHLKFLGAAEAVPAQQLWGVKFGALQ
jgi:hypothetical protein